MKRVLLVTYWYPPRPGAGSLRPAGLAKYLPEYGWEAVVLTPRLPEGPKPPGRVIETQYRDVLGEWKARLGFDSQEGLHAQLNLPVASKPRSRRLHTRLIDCLKWTVAYPDPMKGWIPFAMRAVAELAQAERFNAVLSTAPPVACSIIASQAKRILECPWIADFRDLWTQNPYYARGRIYRAFDESLERRTLKAADALVTVSAPLANLLMQRYPMKPVHCIRNGFEPAEFPSKSPQLTNSFSITYAGELYTGKRDPALLFEVVGDLLREGILPRADVRLRFLGQNEPWLDALVDRYGLREIVTTPGPVPRAVALDWLKESQLLLLLRWNDPREEGVYTGKLFEYLGSRRPILALGGPPGVVPNLLLETKAGVHISSKGDLRQFLIEAYGQFRKSGRVSYSGEEAAINRYTHREMAGKFAQALDSVGGGTTL